MPNRSDVSVSTVVRVAYRPYLEGGRPSLTAGAEVPGETTIPLDAIKSAIPDPLPAPLPQPVSRALARYVDVALSDGRVISYGGFRWPPEIMELRDAMVDAAYQRGLGQRPSTMPNAH